MSRMFSGILGTLAISFSLGAAQYASGSDLVGLARSNAPAPQAASSATTNRDAKTDRAEAPANARKTRTISVPVDGLANTSILVRVSLVREGSGNGNLPAQAKKPVGRTLACEPVVSVLTEVAKQLQPGRCVT
jgi:hypothetical protein